LVVGSISLTFGGSEKVILTRPFWRRLPKSVALPFVEAASMGERASSAFGCFRRATGRWNRASTLAG
jgi:hypothetical protein